MSSVTLLIRLVTIVTGLLLFSNSHAEPKRLPDSSSAFSTIMSERLVEHAKNNPPDKR